MVEPAAAPPENEIMEEKHIVRAYDKDLARLGSLVAEMGGRVEAQLGAAIEAVVRRDSAPAEQAIEDDARVDTLEREVEDQAIRLLALRQPMALDLRAAVAALKISHILERIGDYAANVAKRATVLNRLPPLAPAKAVARMGPPVRQMIKDALDAYADRDADKALAVWRRDAEVDELYDSLFREILTYMMEDARNITPGTHLLFMAKNIERIGDHATNVAEIVHYLARGAAIEAPRPKGDRTAYAVVEPASGRDAEG